MDKYVPAKQIESPLMDELRKLANDVPVSPQELMNRHMRRKLEALQRREKKQPESEPTE